MEPRLQGKRPEIRRHRRFPRALGAAFAGVFATGLFLVFSIRAQQAPVLTVDEDCTAFAFAPDGRVVYAVRHVYKQRDFDLQRDDFWLAERGKKNRRIVSGERLVRGNAPFSYTVRSLRWAPDGTKLTAELLTTAMINERGDTQDQTMTLLLSQDGKEIKISGADSVIPDGSHATWLADGNTVAYLIEAVKPRVFFAIDVVQPAAGHGERLFRNSQFVDVEWLPRSNQAVAIESDPESRGRPRLVLLDLVNQTRTEIAALDRYAGGLCFSPSGQKVAYFTDVDRMEVRALAAPQTPQKVNIPLGKIGWGKDEQRILLKPGLERRSALLEWVRLPGGGVEELLHGLTIHDFEVSADGRLLGVLAPGKHTLTVYPLP
jgi:hypothetical protein